MPAFYIAPEASIKYTFVGPSGARAVLNDPSDSDFVGYLDGEEAISGIDSPEIRDSYSDLADADGGMAGSNFYSRRPIVMNGKVLPTSAADRNTKLGKLMAATDARFADGTMTWTPTGGEPVFVKFRRQLPFRAKGGFNKEFQLGLVANDPRIYTVRAYTRFLETDGGTARIHRRFTYSSGGNLSAATRNFYLPPGTYTIKLPVRASVSGRTLAIWTSEGGGAGVTAVTNGNWQVIERTFVKSSAEATALTISVYLDAALPGSGFVDTGDPIIESAAGLYPSSNAGMASGWSAQANYTASFQTTAPPDVLHTTQPGNAPSLPRMRLLGPGSHIAGAIDPTRYVRLVPNPAYGGGTRRNVDFGFRTVIDPTDNSSKYADVVAPTTWGGIMPDTSHASLLYGISGATSATRMDMTWRGTWL